MLYVKIYINNSNLQHRVSRVATPLSHACPCYLMHLYTCCSVRLTLATAATLVALATPTHAAAAPPR